MLLLLLADRHPLLDHPEEAVRVGFQHLIDVESASGAGSAHHSVGLRCGWGARAGGGGVETTLAAHSGHWDGSDESGGATWSTTARGARLGVLRLSPPPSCRARRQIRL